MGNTVFSQPRAKTHRVRFLSDFRNLKRHLKLKPDPMPKICEILSNLEGFKCATSLELNMGYYRIRLIQHASNLYTIILHWGKYRYKCLPMGDSNSPDIFQEKMKEIFRGFEFIRSVHLLNFDNHKG